MREPDHHRAERPHEAAAQLVEVIEERHLAARFLGGIVVVPVVGIALGGRFGPLARERH